MTNNTSSKILDRIESLEKNIQRLKIETYFTLPKRQQKSLYPEKLLRKSVGSLRKAVWRERYAEKI